MANPVAKRFFAAAFCAPILALATYTPAAAVNPAPTVGTNKGIVLSPPLDKITLGPGLLQARTHIQLTNNTANVYNAEIRLVDFKAEDQGTGFTLGQAGLPLWKYGLANWMRVDGANRITLAPGQTDSVDVLIDNRADLIPGGHYGAVVFAVPGKPSGGVNNIDFSQNLASLLFVKKTGGEKYGLSLTSMNASGGFYIPEAIETSFKNTGNVFVIPRGYIEVKDPGGKLVAQGTINETSNIIIQGSAQKLITPLKPVAPADRNGKYSITAHYRYEGGTQYMTKTIYFSKQSVLSAPIIAAVLAVCGLALIIFMRMKGIGSKTVYNLRAR